MMALIDKKQGAVLGTYADDRLVKIEKDGHFTWERLGYDDGALALVPAEPAERIEGKIVTAQEWQIEDGKVVEKLTLAEPEPEPEPTDQERLEAALGMSVEQVKAVLGLK